MTRQKLKAAMALMSNRDDAAREVAAQLGMSVSTLYAYVDAKDVKLVISDAQAFQGGCHLI